MGNVKMRKTARKSQGKEQSEKFLLKKADVGVGRWGREGRNHSNFQFPILLKKKKEKMHVAIETSRNGLN